MALSEINYKVLSYCEIPEELTEDHWLSDNSPDCYVAYTLQKEGGDERVSNWIRRVYPELIGIEFMIHIDY